MVGPHGTGVGGVGGAVGGGGRCGGGGGRRRRGRGRRAGRRRRPWSAALVVAGTVVVGRLASSPRRRLDDGRRRRIVVVAADARARRRRRRGRAARRSRRSATARRPVRVSRRRAGPLGDRQPAGGLPASPERRVGAGARRRLGRRCDDVGGGSGRAAGVGGGSGADAARSRRELGDHVVVGVDRQVVVVVRRRGLGRGGWQAPDRRSSAISSWSPGTVTSSSSVALVAVTRHADPVSPGRGSSGRGSSCMRRRWRRLRVAAQLGGDARRCTATPRSACSSARRRRRVRGPVDLVGQRRRSGSDGGPSSPSPAYTPHRLVRRRAGRTRVRRPRCTGRRPRPTPRRRVPVVDARLPPAAPAQHLPADDDGGEQRRAGRSARRRRRRATTAHGAEPGAVPNAWRDRLELVVVDLLVLLAGRLDVCGGGGGGGGGLGMAICSVVPPCGSGSGVRERSGRHVDGDPAELAGVELDPRRDVAGRDLGPAVAPRAAGIAVADDDAHRQLGDLGHHGRRRGVLLLEADDRARGPRASSAMRP